MLHLFSLGGVLAVLWALLSGHTDPLMIGLGLASVILVVLVAARMDVVDHEGHPVHLTWRALLYLPWLLWEIVKANIDVVKVILSPKKSLAPQVFTTKATQTSGLGHTIYANSITLTPGTVTIAVTDGELTVHALTTEGAEGVKTGDMDRRVTRMVGEER